MGAYVGYVVVGAKGLAPSVSGVAEAADFVAPATRCRAPPPPRFPDEDAGRGRDGGEDPRRPDHRARHARGWGHVPLFESAAGSAEVPARVDVVQHMCYTFGMSTKSPRIHAVLEPPLYVIVKRLARKHGSSLSQEAHDLIREAVELHEDRALDDLAESRRRSWNPKEALTAAEVRSQLAGR